MRKPSALAVALLLAALASSQTDKPRYEWTQAHTETVEFNALEGKAIALPVNLRAVKVTIEAESAVFSGIFPQQTLVAYGQAHRQLRQADFQNSACHQISVVKGEAACRLDNLGGSRPVFYVRDKRSEGTQALGVLGGLKLNSQLADRATKPNKVTVTFYVPSCVENCPTQ